MGTTHRRAVTRITAIPRLALLGGAVTLGLAATACGGGTTQATQVAATGAPTVAPSTSPTDQPVSTAPPTATAALHTPQPTATPLPAIVIQNPAAGDTVHSPFHVTGSADTFEATFRVRLLDAQGRTLLDQQVHATSGSGTRGTFDTVITTAAKGRASLEAYEVSPKDGSPIHPINVAITIA
jgi:hypothetical protein